MLNFCAKLSFGIQSYSAPPRAAPIRTAPKESEGAATLLYAPERD